MAVKSCAFFSATGNKKDCACCTNVSPTLADGDALKKRPTMGISNAVDVAQAARNSRYNRTYAYTQQQHTLMLVAVSVDYSVYIM